MRAAHGVLQIEATTLSSSKGGCTCLSTGVCHLCKPEAARRKSSFKLLECNDTDITVSSLGVLLHPNQSPDFDTEVLLTFRMKAFPESHDPKSDPQLCLLSSCKRLKVSYAAREAFLVSYFALNWDRSPQSFVVLQYIESTSSINLILYTLPSPPPLYLPNTWDIVPAGISPCTDTTSQFQWLTCCMSRGPPCQPPGSDLIPKYHFRDRLLDHFCYHLS